MITDCFQVSGGLVFLPGAVIYADQQLDDPHFLGKSKKASQHGFFPPTAHISPLPWAFPEEIRRRLRVRLFCQLTVQIGQDLPAAAHQHGIYQIVQVSDLWLVKGMME